MQTTFLNPTLWLLAGLLAAAVWAGVRRVPAYVAFERFMAIATRPAVLIVVTVLALGGVGARIVIGYLAPGAYAEEVVQARALLADRELSSVDARAELAAWLREEPAVTEPWLLPGLSSCQAGAMRDRAHFFSGQAHSPALLLASVPVVRLVGGRGLFIFFTALSLASLALSWWILTAETGWPLRSPRALLLGLALAGWQPALAGLRQGDAVLVAGSLLVCAWAAARRERWSLAGALAGLAGVIWIPALLVVMALVRRPRALVSAVLCGLAAALAVAGAGGWVLLVDFVRNVAFTTRMYADATVNSSVAGRALDWLPGIAIVAIAALVLTIVRTRRVDQAIAALCPLAVLVAPVAWSQHLILVLVPLAVAGTAAVRSNAYSLVAWALTAIVISAPDPPVALLSTAIWPGAGAAWPIVTPALILLWALALARPSSSAIVHEPAAS